MDQIIDENYSPYLNTRHPLPVPDCLIEGRPTWETPSFNYSESINQDTFSKRRAALITHYHGDVVKATHILDTEDEMDLVYMHSYWADQTWHELRAKNSAATAQSWEAERVFFKGLLAAIDADSDEIWALEERLEVSTIEKSRGVYGVKIHGKKPRKLRSSPPTIRRRISQAVPAATETTPLLITRATNATSGSLLITTHFHNAPDPEGSDEEQATPLDTLFCEYTCS